MKSRALAKCGYLGGALVVGGLAWGWADARPEVVFQLAGKPLEVMSVGLREFESADLDDLGAYSVMVIEKNRSYLVIFEDSSSVGKEGSGPRIGFEVELAKPNLEPARRNYIR